MRLLFFFGPKSIGVPSLSLSLLVLSVVPRKDVLPSDQRIFLVSRSAVSVWCGTGLFLKGNLARLGSIEVEEEIKLVDAACECVSSE